LATAVANALGIAHGHANAPGVAHGPGKGQAIGLGHANAPGIAHGPGKGQAIGHGNANAPGIAHGPGKGQAIGHGNANAPGIAHGPGKGQAIGHGNANTPGIAHGPGKGQAIGHGDADAPGIAHGPGKGQAIGHGDANAPGMAHGPGKGQAVNSLPPGQEQQADPDMTLNPATIDSNLDDIEILGPLPNQELAPDRGLTLNLETINLDHGGAVTQGLKPGQEQQADPGITLAAETIYSDPDDIATRGLSSKRILEPEADKQQLSQAIKLLKEKMDLLIRQRLADWQAKIVPGAIESDTDDTSAAALPHRWQFRDNRTHILASTDPELMDDDEGNLWWKLVPYFGVVVLLFSWIVKSGRGAKKSKAAWSELGSVNGPREFPLEDQFEHAGARSSALDKIAAAFSTAGEQRQKAVDEKRGASLEHFTGDPDVEKATAQSEHTQEIEQTFPKAFDGIGLG
jgi:hypothetical protein